MAELPGNLYGLMQRHGDTSTRARKMKRVLVVVDMQRDFMPGGSLPVPEADTLVPIINDLMRDAEQREHFDACLATMDCHPQNHISFVTQHEGAHPGDPVDYGPNGQCLVRAFPPHCVAGTPGAQFAEGLESKRILRTFPKGRHPDCEALSGFYDTRHQQSSGLVEFLRAQETEAVCLVGVALEYCVCETALDSLREGFHTYLVVDATKPVDQEAGQRTLEELQRKGVHLVYLGRSGGQPRQPAAEAYVEHAPGGAHARAVAPEV